MKLLADDYLLNRIINSVNDKEQLQQDLNTMVDSGWVSNTWLMRFNIAKCHLLKITRQKNPANSILSTACNSQEVSYHPYLGVELTELAFSGELKSALSQAKLRESSTFADGISMAVIWKSSHRLLPH